MTLTGAQTREARRLVGWTLSQLSGRVGLSTANIALFESGERQLSFFDVSVIRHALEAAGIEFDDKGHGVRMREEK